MSIRQVTEVLISPKTNVEKRKKAVQLAGQLVPYLFEASPKPIRYNMFSFATSLVLSTLDCPPKSTTTTEIDLDTFTKGSPEDEAAQKMLLYLGLAYGKLTPKEAGLAEFEQKFAAFGLDAYPIVINETEALVMRVESENSSGEQTAQYNVGFIRRS